MPLDVLDRPVDEYSAPAVDWLTFLVRAPLTDAVATLTPADASERLPNVYVTMAFDTLAGHWLTTSLERLIEQRMPTDGGLQARLEAGLQTTDGIEFLDRLAVVLGAMRLGQTGPGKVRDLTPLAATSTIDRFGQNLDVQAMMALVRAHAAARHAGAPWLETSRANELLGKPEVWHQVSCYADARRTSWIMESLSLYAGLLDNHPADDRILQTRSANAHHRMGHERWGAPRLFAEHAAQQVLALITAYAPSCDAAMAGPDGAASIAYLDLADSVLNGAAYRGASSNLAGRTLVALELIQTSLGEDFEPGMIAHLFDSQIEERMVVAGMAVHDSIRMGPLVRARWLREARENPRYLEASLPPAVLLALDAPGRPIPAPAQPQSVEAPQNHATESPVLPVPKTLNVDAWLTETGRTKATENSFARRLARRLGLRG